MEPIQQPKTLKVYMLLKQSGLYFYPSGTMSPGGGISSGFYLTLQEAEANRTLELLKLKDSTEKFHIFELDIPNPAHTD